VSKKSGDYVPFEPMSTGIHVIILRAENKIIFRNRNDYPVRVWPVDYGFPEFRDSIILPARLSSCAEPVVLDTSGKKNEVRYGQSQDARDAYDEATNYGANDEPAEDADEDPDDDPEWDSAEAAFPI
jgi:hypothetical protein